MYRDLFNCAAQMNKYAYQLEVKQHLLNELLEKLK